MKTVLSILAVIGIIVASVMFGRWLQKPTIDELATRNRALAAQDSTREIELAEGRVAYERIVFDFADAEEAHRFASDSMGDIINALKDKAEEDGRVIETMASANSYLRDRVRGLVGDIMISDSLITAHIEARKDYEDGNITAAGDINISIPEEGEPSGTADLEFGVEMSPTILISRDSETGIAQCDLSFGDMPITTEDLMCVNNFDVDLPTRSAITLPTIVGTALIALGIIGLGSLVF